MNNQALLIAEELIKRHEGFSNSVYLDTMGVPTVGWGHAVFDNSLKVGMVLSTQQCEQLFRKDLMSIVNDYNSLYSKYGYRFHNNLSNRRTAVVLDMLFNLGLPKLLKFKNFLSALNTGNYTMAANEMLNSKWAKQVGYRAKELYSIILNG